MAGVEKILLKMKNQPNGITYNEAEKVLEAYDYKFIRQKGSHCHFRNANGDLITIKKDTPTLKAAYIKDILSRIDK